jgi:hypothetical protein
MFHVNPALRLCNTVTPFYFHDADAVQPFSGQRHPFFQQIDSAKWFNHVSKICQPRLILRVEGMGMVGSSWLHTSVRRLTAEFAL